MRRNSRARKNEPKRGRSRTIRITPRGLAILQLVEHGLYNFAPSRGMKPRKRHAARN